jgi:tRNA U34 5-methylaminomethyl-2-thiouridine-forming methyltransferase MnmC
MDQVLRLCEDGSHTVYSDRAGECYHSTHGAYTESQHIFIDAGFRALLETHSVIPYQGNATTVQSVRILEVGFGTGLNALLTALAAENITNSVSYVGLEPYPIQSDILQQLNYCTLLSGNSQTYFSAMHDSAWGMPQMLHPCFSFKKLLSGFMDVELAKNSFDLIYFDAFSPEAQPDLWEQEVFDKCFQVMARDGILVTYCAKGRVKRALRSAGFSIENLTGPPGKREITRARKLI